MPSERKAHDLIVEKTAALKAARKKLSLPEIRKVLLEKLGMEMPSVPHYRVLRSVLLPERDPDYACRFGLETEPGRVMSILFSYGIGKNYIEGAEKIRLFIPHQDSLAEIGSGTEEGIDLYALDMRGIGECTPTSCNMPAGGNFFASYGFDFHYTALGDMFGQSYLGGKVKDILSAVELLAQHTGYIELEGHGIGGISALIAAVLSDNVCKLRLVDVPDSWESMVDPVWPPAEKSPMSYMILGILEFLDLPDLRKAIADKIIS